jgi:hypothetical protein
MILYSAYYIDVYRPRLHLRAASVKNLWNFITGIEADFSERPKTFKLTLDGETLRDVFASLRSFVCKRNKRSRNFVDDRQMDHHFIHTQRVILFYFFIFFNKIKNNNEFDFFFMMEWRSGETTGFITRLWNCWLG